MSHYGDYIKEREGIDILEDEYGFATYCFPFSNAVYIIETYVVPNMRDKGIASSYANSICEYAKSRGAKYLIGSIDPKTDSADTSRKVLEGYGMTRALIDLDPRLEYYMKEI